MLERLTGWFHLLWDSGKLLQEHSADIKELKQQNGQLLHLVQLLAVQNQQMSNDVKHERELRQEQIDSLRRELADSQEKTELRLRLEISEKLRQLPPRE
jgi:predicted RNase H-like nuclease (RuvC/YqgF family)